MSNFSIKFLTNDDVLCSQKENIYRFILLTGECDSYEMHTYLDEEYNVVFQLLIKGLCNPYIIDCLESWFPRANCEKLNNSELMKLEKELNKKRYISTLNSEYFNKIYEILNINYARKQAN